MKLWLKILIAAIGGFGGGFATGFFVHKRINDIQFEEISEEEMAEIEASLPKLDKLKETPSEMPLEATKKALEGAETPEDIQKVLQGKTPFLEADKATKKAYEKMWEATKNYSDEGNANNIPTYPVSDPEDEKEDLGSPIDLEESLGEEFLEAIEQEEVEPGSNFVEPPHIITLGEFYNERPEYDKVTINWYSDDIWTDEQEEIIPNIESYIGLEVKSLFASNDPDEDPDVRFVRNERYGSDYEIIRHHKTWVESLAGGE